MAYSPTASNPRRVIGFVAVVIFHVFIIWALKVGLAQSVVAKITGPIETKLIEEIKPEKEEPPPPPPKFTAPPPPTVIMPEIALEAPPAPSETAITAAPARQQAAPTQVERTNPRSNPRRPNQKPEYPPTSKRLGEQGVVTLMLTINEEGKVSDASVAKSSGFERLDEAAKAEALRSWRFIPGTIGGKPASMQITINVRFNLEDER